MRRRSNSRDVTSDIGGAFGGVGYVSRHFIGSGALLFDSRGNGPRDVVDLIDNGTDRSDSLDSTVGMRLNRSDFVADVFGGLGCLAGQFFHFVGDNGEAFSSFSGARSLDGGVEG